MTCFARSSVRAVSVCCVLAVGMHALAQEDDANEQRSTVEHSAETGNLLAMSQAAALDAQSAYAAVRGGYDGARSTGLFEMTAAARIWGPVALRAGATLTTRDVQLKPFAGIGLQAMSEATQGIDLAAFATYKPEGLTEPEGEIEAVVAAGTHVGRTYLLVNLAYGQDPEGRERDAELRLAELTRWSAFFAGLDARARADLGSDAARRDQKREPRFDLALGPVVQLVTGPLAWQLQSGLSAVRLMGQTLYGAFVLSGVAAPF